MKRGKKICQTLKDIRLQVARANDIPYEPTECKHKGDCLGTCPKCEQEVRYIEHQLNIRRMLGKAAAVAGMAMGVSLAAQPIEAMAQNNVTAPKDSTVISALQTLKVESLLKEGEQGIVVRGRVIDSDSIGIIGAIVGRKDINKWAITDQNGLFAVEVPEGCPLQINYVGYIPFLFEASEQLQVIEMVLNEDVQGYVVPIKGRVQSDDVYGHGF